MKNPLINNIDNCLLCKHCDIKDNEFAKWCKHIGLTWLGSKLGRFPVTLCKLSEDRYISNPLAKPGWCRKR